MSCVDGDVLEMFEKSLPPIVPRSKVSELTGGWISSGYMSNLDSEGKGPRKISCGLKKVAYTREDFVDWLRAMNGGGAA